MGLDWCVNDKTIPDMDSSRSFAEAQLGNITEEIEKLWCEYLKDNGDGREPGIYPNPILDEFQKTSDYKKIREKKDHWQEIRDRNVISPMETLNVPRIGVDPAADQYAKEYYMNAGDKLKEQFKTVEAYMEANKGMYVPDLVKSPGMGSVTGIFVGAESFRGKCIAYMEWLEEWGFDEDCYEDRNPGELEKLGEALDGVADRYESNNLFAKIPEEIKEDLKLIREAAEWCLFWSENGHGIRAWY
jgi:hypothetical protein